jgi:hypothetical protein
MLIIAIVCGAEVTWVDTCMNKKMKLQVLVFSETPVFSENHLLLVWF